MNKNGKHLDRGAYHRWLAKAPPGTESRARLALVNSGPYEAGELRELFSSLPQDDLARCWVPCVVDSLSQFGLDLGNAARALAVVARRLHGVSIPMVASKGVIPVSEQQKASARVGETGYVVMYGPLPAAKRGARHDPVSLAISRLKPGQHILFDLDKFKKSTLVSKANKVRKETGWGKRLFAYATDNNGFCVALQEDRD